MPNIARLVSTRFTDDIVYKPLSFRDVLPLKGDFLQLSEEICPYIYYHFCFQGKAVFVASFRSSFAVYSQNWFPTDLKISYIDSRKDFILLAVFDTLKLAVDYFELLVRDLLPSAQKELF